MVTISQNSLLNYCDSFVSTHLDSSCRSRFRFNVGGFFLESSIDAKIKSVPVFIFSLQRHEVRQTYISCFYAQDFPVLFENFNKKREFKDDFFFLIDLIMRIWFLNTRCTRMTYQMFFIIVKIVFLITEFLILRSANLVSQEGLLALSVFNQRPFLSNPDLLEGLGFIKESSIDCLNNTHNGHKTRIS